MGVQSTVVFADLFGSTGVFESLGNAKATEAVTQITAWLAEKFKANGGRVVKFLGDGVLVLFKENRHALAAVVDVQRAYEQRLTSAGSGVYMPLRIGVARGDVEMVEDDCYGDAVNIAARLSELTGPHQIWVNAEAIGGGKLSPDIRSRLLGPIHVRGRAEPCTVYQIEWQEDVDSEFFTIQSPLADGFDASQRDVLGSQIELSYLDSRKTFKAFELPMHIGRMREAEFVVSDLHVSRKHARLDWRNGSVVLTDVSSYGCWVRFFGGGSDLLLRREECVLHGRGEIALGTPFGDLGAPVVTFSVR
ncbi:MAG: adenylate/guanylate cyclase domain-containing protein [Rhodoferax sp.]|uniref:adenylate/guanylate cyclase domain-containing protein n=1 Tax=Rhodoferax sp. TaxID=50421 RepID=UPI002611E5DA|nr:adenylate/guanylate cyclase domain-containing protein [Rhodoferax sp.]MDD2879182.1 adenylate/guanylate cyclase domain-containing protein [Rhodoferax sp.]